MQKWKSETKETPKQSLLPSSWRVIPEYEPDESSDESQGLNESSQRRRQLWSRVKSTPMMQAGDHSVFDIEKDITLDNALKVIRKLIAQNRGAFIFDPTIYTSKIMDFRLEEHRLDKTQLHAYALVATRIRNRFTDESNSMRDQNQQNSESQDCDQAVYQRVKNRSYEDTQRDTQNQLLQLGFEARSSENSRKKLRKRDFSSKQLLYIAQWASHYGMTQAQTASRFNITTKLAQQILSDFKKGGSVIKKQLQKEQILQKKLDATRSTIFDARTCGMNIWKSQQVQQQVRSDYDLKVSLTTIREILKLEFGMKYKTVKKIPFTGNSDRCLVLRMLYAQKMLALLDSGKVIINVEESFLAETCFKRKKWRQKGETNSVPAKMFKHRVSMIAALSSQGDCFVSLTQVNTDSQVMLAFFSQLAKLLQKQNPSWRQDYVFLLDGASYHKEAKLRQYLMQMGMQVVISAPYSYDAAPVELFFAYFKQTEINPDKLPVGKSKFQNLTRLCHERILLMRHEVYPLFWRHCALSLYNYLSFTKI